MYRAIIPILLLMLSCSPAPQGMSPGEDSPPSLPLGLWVWRDTDFNTPLARQELLDFSQQYGITHLDVHARLIEGDSDGDGEGEGGLVLREAQAMARLTIEAGERGITVAALRGAPRMFLEESREQTLKELRALIAFDQSLAAGPGSEPGSGPGLSGVKYDVEPYATPEWRGGGDLKLKVMEDYLVTLTAIRQIIDADAPDLILATDVPFWWDKPEHELAFGDRQQSLSSHVQDLADYVAIMSYRRGASQVIDCVTTELAYAGQVGRTICPSLETGELQADQHISFFGTSQDTFWACLDGLRAEYNGHPSVRMIMLHHYGTVRAYLEGAAPITPESL